MLTAKLCVAFEGDWTARLEEYDLSASFLASRFRDRAYIGLLAVETAHLAEVVEVIEGHESITAVDLVESADRDGRGRQTATLLLEGELEESTPLKALLHAGYLPLRPASIEAGRECFDLLLRDRAALPEAIALLEEFGPVSVERITTDYRHEVVPSPTEWQAILATMPARRRDILETAVAEGYFETPRGITLAELADIEEITTSTASNHLRKAQRAVFEFLLPYLSLTGDASSK